MVTPNILYWLFSKYLALGKRPGDLKLNFFPKEVLFVRTDILPIDILLSNMLNFLKNS